MNSQPARFGELFSAAWARFAARQSIILPGAAIFAVLGVLTQLPAAGIERAQDASTVSIAVATGTAGAIVGLLSAVYFLVAVVRTDTSVGAVFSRVWPRIIPFLGLSLLTMIKTYGWLAILGGLLLAGAAYNPLLMPLGLLLIAAGVVCSIIFGPRYMLAGVLWLVEGKDVRASVERSYSITTGYWGKIIGNTLLVVLIFMAVMAGVGIVSGILGGIAGAAGGNKSALMVTGLITGFVSHCYTAFMTVFLFKLTEALRGSTSTSAPAAQKAATKKPQAVVKKTVKKTMKKKK